MSRSRNDPSSGCESESGPQTRSRKRKALLLMKESSTSSPPQQGQRQRQNRTVRFFLEQQIQITFEVKEDFYGSSALSGFLKRLSCMSGDWKEAMNCIANQCLVLSKSRMTHLESIHAIHDSMFALLERNTLTSVSSVPWLLFILKLAVEPWARGLSSRFGRDGRLAHGSEHLSQDLIHWQSFFKNRATPELMSLLEPSQSLRIASEVSTPSCYSVSSTFSKCLHLLDQNANYRIDTQKGLVSTLDLVVLMIILILSHSETLGSTLRSEFYHELVGSGLFRDTEMELIVNRISFLGSAFIHNYVPNSRPGTCLRKSIVQGRTLLHLTIHALVCLRATFSDLSRRSDGLMGKLYPFGWNWFDACIPFLSRIEPSFLINRNRPIRTDTFTSDSRPEASSNCSYALEEDDDVSWVYGALSSSDNTNQDQNVRRRNWLDHDRDLLFLHSQKRILKFCLRNFAARSLSAEQQGANENAFAGIGVQGSQDAQMESESESGEVEVEDEEDEQQPNVGPSEHRQPPPVLSAGPLSPGSRTALQVLEEGMRQLSRQNLPPPPPQQPQPQAAFSSGEAIVRIEDLAGRAALAVSESELRQAASLIFAGPVLPIVTRSRWRIRRSHLVQDVLEHLSALDFCMDKSRTLPNFEVVFEGEEQARDLGGVRVECMDLFFRELCGPNAFLFDRIEGTDFVWPRRMSPVHASKMSVQAFFQTLFAAIGSALALCVIHGIKPSFPLDFELFFELAKKNSCTASVFNGKYHAHQPGSESEFNDLARRVQRSFPTVFRSMIRLSEMKASELESLELGTADLPETVRYVHLTTQGSAPLSMHAYPSCIEPDSEANLFLDSEDARIDFESLIRTSPHAIQLNNKDGILGSKELRPYMTEVFRFYSEPHASVLAMLAGFSNLLPIEELTLLEPRTLALFLAPRSVRGSELVPLLDWDYDSFSRLPEEKFFEFRHAFETILSEWSEEDAERFLLFATSSSAAGPVKITLHGGAVPFAYTCFRQIMVPYHTELSEIRRYMAVALENCRGFGNV